MHRNLQMRLRSLSVEDDQDFAMILGGCGGMPMATPVAKEKTVPARAADVEVESEKPKISRIKSLSTFWRLHDGLEDWGYRNFPAITDSFNVLVYSLDLAVRSVRWFQFGIVAVCLGFRLFVYAIMLLPAFLKIFFAYYHDRRIQRRVRFGPAEREYLDIYIPEEALAAQKSGQPVPVVIAVMGGAFVIGHRGYNAQLGLRLMDFGVITVGIDYRNFPRGQIPDMVEDVGRGVRWVFQNIHMYGGDPKNMMLVGQSAGAHLAAMLVLEHGLLQAMDQANGGSTGEARLPMLPRGHSGSGHDIDAWSVSDLKCFLGVSGPYDLVKLGPHLASRGLYPRIVDHLTSGDVAGCSPERLLETDDWKAHAGAVAKLLPPIHLFHGYCDQAVPVWASSDFAERLREAGVENVTLDLRKGMSHTYPVIEGPMQRHDPQVELILPVLFGKGAQKRLEDSPKLPPMWPLRILNVAGYINPF